MDWNNIYEIDNQSSVEYAEEYIQPKKKVIGKHQHISDLIGGEDFYKSINNI